MVDRMPWRQRIRVPDRWPRTWNAATEWPRGDGSVDLVVRPGRNGPCHFRSRWVEGPSLLTDTQDHRVKLGDGRKILAESDSVDLHCEKRSWVERP